MDVEKMNPLDKYAAMQKMMSETGWKIFQYEVNEIGEPFLKDTLDPDLSDSGTKYTKRDLRVHQLSVVKRISNIPSLIKEEAKVFEAAKKLEGGNSAKD